MTQGERVLKVRKTLKMTMDKFGERLGVQKSAISKIEKDKVKLSDQMARFICKEYNVNYDYLIYGEGEMFDDFPKTILDELCKQYHCDELDRNLIEEYLNLDPATRKVLKDYIKNILKNRKE